MRRLEIDIEPVQISLTDEEILSDLLYPAGTTGGAEAPPVASPKLRR